MDILSHSLSGLALGTVLASFAKGPRRKLAVLGTATFGGALPDLDAISMWSGFDRTFGSWFQLNQSGPFIYSAKFWCSHHAFFHSLLAPLLWLGLYYGLQLAWKGLRRKNSPVGLSSLKSQKLRLVAFVGGYWIHLLEDLPTPAATWGGVNLFWPSPSYIGGWGNIWWWNNYDIFLIILAVIVVNLLLAGLNHLRPFAIRKMSLIVFSLGFSLALFQIKTRDFNFAYQGACPDYTLYEQESKRIQKEILGERVFRLMESFDQRLKIYF